MGKKKQNNLNIEGASAAEITEKKESENPDGAGVFGVTENNEDAKRIAKKRERNHRYYIRHIERLQGKARDRYYLIREKEDASGEETKRTFKETSVSNLNYGNGAMFSVALLVSLIAVVALFAEPKKKEKKEAAIAPPVQNSRKFDIGGGQFIDIPIIKQS